jgi:hypothetical protein
LTVAFSEENEDVLRRLGAECDDLTQPREIDFTVVFPNELSAQAFAGKVETMDVSVSVEESGTAEGLQWDVVVTKMMVPENGAITEFEEYLAELAIQYGGRNDGWGCFNVVSEKNIQ